MTAVLCDTKFCGHVSTWVRGSHDLAIYGCDEHGPTHTDQIGWRRLEGAAQMTIDNEEVEIDAALVARIEHSLTNQTPDREQIERIEALRESAKQLGTVIAAYCHDSRERSLAVTHLEETVMWAVKGIVLEEATT